MRASIRDTEYFTSGKRYRVFLDDKELEWCFAADEEAGEAWRYQTDDSGDLIIKEHDILEERLTGCVRMEAFDVTPA